MTKVTLSPLTEADLDEIFDFIAEDNPFRAFTFVGEMRNYMTTFAFFPNKGIVREDLGEGVRMAMFGSYNIYYTILTDGITVDRIIHSARRHNNR